MIGHHLMASCVKVRRGRLSTEDGVLTTSWHDVPGLSRVGCRLEVGLYRPGKDQPLPIQAGRAPDRVAVLWILPGTTLYPGDHLECIEGDVSGTWELRSKLDDVIAMRRLHHREGQVVELHPSVVS